MHCLRCGTSTRSEVRGGRSRPVCPDCGWVYWRNPKAAVAVILRNDSGEVLLVRRTSAPSGSWCIPCGNIEWNEDIRGAAIRELEEETGLRVRIGQPYAVLSNFHDPENRSVGVWFLGAIAGGNERPGGDASELAWCRPDRPLEPLAFPTDRIVLRALAEGRPWAGPEVVPDSGT